MKNKLMGILAATIIGGALVMGCNSAAEEAAPPTPQQEAGAPPAPPAPAPQTETAAVEDLQPEAVVEAKTQPAVDEALPVETGAKAEAIEPELGEPEQVTDAAPAEAFTATTGLADFTAYRLNFETRFDGVTDGAPSAGSLGGLFEVTRTPEAQHWLINMDGSAFAELALLGGKMEMYNIGDTIYLQNPGDGGFIGMPAMFVSSMLPADMINPEDSIELPATATPQPGEEIINGVAAHRYTFGQDDLTGDTSNYDSVEGTVWVAVDGNYVVKYQAAITGKFNNLTAGDLKVLDEGTITMEYELADANGDFTIAPPAGAKTIDLNQLLFN